MLLTYMLDSLSRKTHRGNTVFQRNVYLAFNYSNIFNQAGTLILIRDTLEIRKLRTFDFCNPNYQVLVIDHLR